MNKKEMLEQVTKCVRLKLRHIMLISGNTVKTVDATLGRRKGWTQKKLDRPASLKLNDISDIALACRYEMEFKIVNGIPEPIE